MGAELNSSCFRFLNAVMEVGWLMHVDLDKGDHGEPQLTTAEVTSQ